MWSARWYSRVASATSCAVACPRFLGSYGQLLRSTFVSPQVQALIGWMAAQSGPPPTAPLSGSFALWHPMYHNSGIKRPEGGSGMLTQALARMIAAHGGVVVTDADVSRILVENGKAVGAETASVSPRGGPLFPARISTRLCAYWQVRLRRHGWRWRKERERGTDLA